MNANLLQLVFCSLALTSALVITVTDNSSAELNALQNKLSSQRTENFKLSRIVGDLEKQIYYIAKSERYLEQLVRNELALAKDNEEVVLFER
jgi:cell division protein FtsB